MSYQYPPDPNDYVSPLRKRNVCPHSSKRTCNGGFNSCISCPKTFEKVEGKQSFSNRLLSFFIGLALLITVLILCTMCRTIKQIESSGNLPQSKQRDIAAIKFARGKVTPTQFGVYSIWFFIFFSYVNYETDK